MFGIVDGKEHRMARILLVEDDKLLQDIYVEVLRSEGYTITTADNGNDALTLLREGGYDLVLLDVVLPNKNGLDVMRELKKHPPKNPNKQIVVMSNLYQEALPKELASLGITKHIVKSNINPEELLQEVKKILSL